jgi:hypothetical protein
MDMDASAELRDRLIRDAKEVLLPFKTWWKQHGVPFKAATLSSYFNQQMGTRLHEAEAEIEGLAGQHPRFLTAIQLSDFEKRFTALPDSWWMLREARLFETLRREVKPTALDQHAILQEIHLCVHKISGAWRQVQVAPPYGGGILEVESLIREMAFVADVAIQLSQSATEFIQDDLLGDRRVPFPPAHRFKVEHDWLYLKFLRAYSGKLTEQFFAVHSSAGALLFRISEALPEWHDMLSRLQASPLTAYSWHCHRDLQVLSTRQDFSLVELQRAYDETYLAVQEANQA